MGVVRQGEDPSEERVHLGSVRTAVSGTRRLVKDNEKAGTIISPGPSSLAVTS